MEPLDPSLKFILERAHETAPVMTRLAGLPYNWLWQGISPNNYAGHIDAVDRQVEVLTGAEAASTNAGADWDLVLGRLTDQTALGIRLGRVHFKDQPVKLRLLDNLRMDATNRDAKYRQVLDFESSWQKADPAWVFKDNDNQDVALANFTLRRKSIKDLEDAYYRVQKTEQHERALLHSMAEKLNVVSVDWYEVATATFGGDTVPGQLIRTIPTTYDPNRPPGPVEFSEHSAPAPNEAHLRWRAPRGQRFKILGKPPGGNEFDVMLENVGNNEWLGMGLEPGEWTFKGRASNQFGEGPESGEVTVPVKAA